MSKIAFVFPGQGSQQVGMLQDLADQYPIVTQIFEQASDSLGFDLWNIIQNNPQDALSQTQNTQPALLAASYAIYKVITSNTEFVPALMSGHSLGEYSALVCAGALDFSEAVKLVHMRGQFMQNAVPAGVGSMAAIIGLDDAVIESVCAQINAVGNIVSPVNYNSPGQVVIAGHTGAVQQAMAALKESGAKRALPLAVSVPSHCELMKPAAENMQSALVAINIVAPHIPVIHNVDAKIETDPALIKEKLVQQLYKPVLWVANIEEMVRQDIDTVIEVGPGKVLSGLNKRIHKSLSVSSVNDCASLEAFLTSI